MSEHSIIPPSSAGIWGKPGGCTGWVKMARKYLEPDEPSEDAAAGTASHEAGAKMIALNRLNARQVGDTASNGVVITPEMLEGAQLYASDVLETKFIQGAPISYGIEKRIKAPSVHELSEGTPDMWLYNSGTKDLYLWDYKFGYLVVEAFENWQGINYAAGTIDELGLDGQSITIHIRIVQPRGFHRDGPIREWTLKSFDLQGYVNTLAINARTALGPDATLHTGSHCRYCQARHACPAALSSGMGMYEMSAAPIPVDLSPEALGVQLTITTRATEQLKAIQSGLEEQVKVLQKSGVVVPGWGLESTYGNKTWARPVGEVFALGELFGKDLRQNKAITPNQAIKLGIDEAVIKAYSACKRTGVKLVQDKGNKAKQIFTGGK